MDGRMHGWMDGCMYVCMYIIERIERFTFISLELVNCLRLLWTILNLNQH